MVNNLKTLREERGWTVLQLAAKSGVPKEIVGQLELATDFGGFEPSDILKITRPFEVHVKEVFAFVEKEENENT